VTAVTFPESHDADDFRAIVREQNMSLGGGLGPLKGKVVRIGHLGDFNELMLLGTLGGFELGLRVAGVPHKPGGVQAAIEYLGDGKTK
jgi:alanine-glyoxylate transaminase/serine-glyoxylate transaminase/serine-pyruvate transaminase